MGFFTDSSVCIGCKACEVACKEWNGVPDSKPAWSGNSYDNTLRLGANSWRHVAFVERVRQDDAAGVRWLMSSDVCKHCTRAACLEVCPTGAIFRSEFGTVVVQDDVCNGCGYCVVACPFGVIERREDDGRAFDPAVHEAVSTVSGEGLTPGTVAQVVRPGYGPDDKLLRPAAVVVATRAS